MTRRLLLPIDVIAISFLIAMHFHENQTDTSRKLGVTTGQVRMASPPHFVA
jgi:hypothetical protein